MGHVLFFEHRRAYGAPHRRSFLYIALVLALVMSQMVFVADRALAAGHITGLGSEAAVLENEVYFNTLETEEIQWIWNDAIAPVNEVQNISHGGLGGDFTLTYAGSAESDAIDFAALPGVVETAIEGLSTITDVTVTGVPGNYDVTFIDPGLRDNELLVVGTNNLTPDPTPISITETTKGGNGTFTLSFGNETTGPIRGNAAAAEVEAALEALVGIPDDLVVTGNGNAGDEWKVTFPRGVPMLSATDSLFMGKTTSITENTKGTSAPIDSAGIAYLGGTFLVSDSEIDEEPTVYDNVNVWEFTNVPTIVRTAVFDESPIEPTGLDYNSSGNGRLYISNDSSGLIFDVDLGLDGIFGTGDDSFTTFDTEAAGISDPEDVAWDPVGGQVFIASGVGVGADPITVTPVHPGADGALGGGDDIVGTTMDFSGMLGDLEGLGYRAESDTLLLVDPTGSELIYEMTKDGRLVRTIGINPTQRPSDVVVAPASAGGGNNLYLVDRGTDNNTAEPPPRDGRWYEFSTAFANLAPFVDAGTDQVIAFGAQAALVGDSYDDGQGSAYGAPPFVPSVVWSKVSGPGTVTFDDDTALSTNASFSQSGVYVLKLESTDGDLSNEDTIQVTMSPDPNMAPVVNAGPDQTITLPNIATMEGLANDDGLPNPPGALTTTWSKVSGPGVVTFADSTALDTTASFSLSGTYVLRLTGDDGAKVTTDEVVVTVNPPPTGGGGGGGGVPPIEPDTFADDDDSIFEQDIEWMVAEGITNGCGPARFCPDAEVTRGQLAAFLVRALGLTAGEGANLFIDDNGHFFESEIDRLATAGITKGCAPQLFCPDDPVTRAEVAAMLVRALNLTFGGGSDLFIDDDGHQFEIHINRLGEAGITKGCGPQLFCPDDSLTRGQIAAFLHRALG